MSITTRIKASMGWNAGAMALTQAIGIGRAIILARLLTPDDYGLFGMATAVLGAMNVLTNLGFDLSLIVRTFQSEREQSSYLDTIWTMELARRLLLTLSLLAVIQPTVMFYKDPRLYAILPVVALTPFAQGFQNIGLALYKKQIAFKRVVLYEQASGILTTCILIVLALVTRSVWALVLGQFVGTMISVVLSYIFHPYRPRLAWDKTVVHRSLGFGKYVFVVSVMTYITTTADNLALGRMAGSEALGNYVFAYNLASMSVVMTMSIVSSVLYPAYAELKTGAQDQLERVIDRIFLASSCGLIMVALVLLLLSKEIVLVLFGTKWAVSIPLLRILALVGLFRSLTHVLAPLAYSLEKPKFEAQAKSFEGLVFLALLYPLIKTGGAAGAAWAGVIVYAIAFVARFLIIRHLVPQVSGKIFRSLLLSLAAATCGGACALFLLSFIEGRFWRLIVGTPIALSVTTAGMLVVHPVLRHEVSQWLTSIRRGSA